MKSVYLDASVPSAYYKESYLNPTSEEKYYFSLLSQPKKPPDFTKPLFEKKPDEIQIKTHEKIKPDPNYVYQSIEETRKQKPDIKIEVMKL